MAIEVIYQCDRCAVRERADHDTSRALDRQDLPTGWSEWAMRRGVAILGGKLKSPTLLCVMCTKALKEKWMDYASSGT